MGLLYCVQSMWAENATTQPLSLPPLLWVHYSSLPPPPPPHPPFFVCFIFCFLHYSPPSSLDFPLSKLHPPPSRSAVPGYVTFGQPPPPHLFACVHSFLSSRLWPPPALPCSCLLPAAARPTFLKSKDGVCFSFMVFVDHFKQVETSAKDIIWLLAHQTCHFIDHLLSLSVCQHQFTTVC